MSLLNSRLVDFNAITSAVRLLNLSIDMNMGWRISQALEYVDASLNKLLNSHERLRVDDVAYTESAIGRLSNEYAVPAANVRQLLTQIISKKGSRPTE